MKFIHILSTFLRDLYLADFFVKTARGYHLSGKIAFMAFYEHVIRSNECRAYFMFFCADLDPVIYHVFVYIFLSLFCYSVYIFVPL